jgi:uncharacterized membrane protein
MELDFSQIFKAYLILLVILFVFDAIWLTLTNKRFYAKALGSLFAEKMKIVPAILFYLVYPLGIAIFVISPNLVSPNLLQVGLLGALFGFVCYGTYDFTNLATIKNWPLKVTIVDLIWGSSLTAAASVICMLLF